jgi:hypothetical protein
MIETFQGFLLFIVFLVPGFVFRTVEGQLVYLDKRLDWGRFALGLLTRSTLVYLPAIPFIYSGWQQNSVESDPWRTTLGMVAVLLILPALLGLLSGFVRQKRFPQHLLRRIGLGTFEQHHIPTAWDHLFSEVQPAWVIVRLKDDSRIRGLLGPNSYASSDPEDRDLFISHVLIEDPDSDNGSFKFAPDTEGVYIRGEDISTIELSHYEEPDDSTE